MERVSNVFPSLSRMLGSFLIKSNGRDFIFYWSRDMLKSAMKPNSSFYISSNSILETINGLLLLSSGISLEIDYL